MDKHKPNFHGQCSYCGKHIHKYVPSTWLRRKSKHVYCNAACSSKGYSANYKRLTPQQKKEYKHKYWKRWYSRAKNQARHRQRNYHLVKERRNKLRAWLYRYKQQRGCITCEENNPACLDLHHHGNNKVMDVSALVSHAYHLAALQKEVKKCIIKCANCHRKETAARQNWYKGLI